MRQPVGRKKIGPMQRVRLEHALVDELDAAALVLGVSRAEVMRELIRDGLRQVKRGERE